MPGGVDSDEQLRCQAAISQAGQHADEADADSDGLLQSDELPESSATVKKAVAHSGYTNSAETVAMTDAVSRVVIDAAIADMKKCCRTRMATQRFLRWLRSANEQRQQARLDLAAGVTRLCNELLAPQKCTLALFGSCRYLMELPNSDCDFCVVLPARCTTAGMHLLAKVKDDISRIDGRKPKLVACKKTMEFHYHGLDCDVTFAKGSAENLAQIVFSDHLRSAVMALPAKMRDALRLLIIVAKYRRIAVKKGESYGQRLKGVHWLMMGLAAWDSARVHLENRSVDHCLGYCLSFFLHFQFDRHGIFLDSDGTARRINREKSAAMDAYAGDAVVMLTSTALWRNCTSYVSRDNLLLAKTSCGSLLKEIQEERLWLIWPEISTFHKNWEEFIYSRSDRSAGRSNGERTA